MRVYLGVDLGAESGRVMAGLWDGRRLRLEELHRFANGPVRIAGTLRWDVLRLWAEIQNGIAIAGKKFGASIASVGVDTWGVDFVLLSKSGELLGLPYHYRDNRTRGILPEAFQRMARAEIFSETGLQFMEINTLYQLLALQKTSPELLDAADCFLTIPDFFNWCLCGAKVAEFTNASTTQCLNPITRDWSSQVLQQFNLPARIFPKIVQPGVVLGSIRRSVADATGLGKIDAIAPATHDTGSAVAGVPTEHTGNSNWAYISSGTWSLIGIEVSQANLGARVLELNLTNEGGVDGTFRLLKNVMGLWLIQQCKRAFEANGKQFDYGGLVTLAEQAPPYQSFIDPDDPRFLNPASMPAAIQEFCRETRQPIPSSEGEIVRCAFESLALKYRRVLEGIEAVNGCRLDVIHIVGGGSRNHLLNQFTASACARRVVAGPVEATLLGNLLVQMRTRKEVNSLHDMRLISRDADEIRNFEPVCIERWNEAFQRFVQVCDARL